MTLKAAIGACTRVLSRSHMIYAPPLLCETTIIGPRYHGRILQLSTFSITVLHTKTSALHLKLKSRMVTVCSCSNQITVRLHALCTRCLSWAKSSCLFCSTFAWCTMRSVVESRESGGGSK